MLSSSGQANPSLITSFNIWRWVEVITSFVCCCVLLISHRATFEIQLRARPVAKPMNLTLVRTGKMAERFLLSEDGLTQNVCKVIVAGIAAYKAVNKKQELALRLTSTETHFILFQQYGFQVFETVKFPNFQYLFRSKRSLSGHVQELCRITA